MGKLLFRRELGGRWKIYTCQVTDPTLGQFEQLIDTVVDAGTVGVESFTPNLDLSGHSAFFRGDCGAKPSIAVRVNCVRPGGPCLARVVHEGVRLSSLGNRNTSARVVS